MEIEFYLDEEDLLAMANYRIQYVPAFRQRIQSLRFAYLIGFIFLAVGVSMMDFGPMLAALVLAIGAIFFLLYPTYHNWTVRRRVHEAYLDPKMQASLGMRTLRITADHLEEISSLGEAKTRWSVIESIKCTPTRAFITVAGDIPSMVIPKERTTAGNYDEFVTACQSRIQLGYGRRADNW
jgi:hypothetical protein